MQFRSKWLSIAPLLVALLTARDAWAARPAESLLPAKTVGFLAFPSPSRLEQRFRLSHYQALLNDTRLAGLAADFKQTTGDFRKEIQDRLGLDWDGLVACTSGELALAVLPPAGGKAALVLIADVTGREPQAQAQLDEQRKARGELAHAVREGLLLAAENAEALQTLMNGWDRKADDQLGQAVAYQTVMKRSQALLGSHEAQLRAYYVPLAWAEATAPKKAEAPEADASTLDNVAIMRRQGLAAIQGVGGLLSFPDKEYDSLVALAVYAPPPFKKAMRLLDFPGAAATGAAAWVPKDVGSHITLSWNLKDFWRHYGSLYDDLNADGIEGAFNDLLDGLRDDPEGAQIDARKDFFPNLSDQVTVVTGPPAKEKPGQTSTLYVLTATTDMTPLLRRYWEGDPDVHKIDWHGHEIWEIVAPKDDDADSANALNFISAAAFSNQCLFLSTDATLLKNALAPHAENETLAAAPEFRDVQKRLDVLQTGSPFLRLFSWPEYAVRDVQRLFHSATGKDKEKPLTPAPAVPNAAVERQHLGAMGARMDRVENGWTLTGFTLPASPR